MRPIGDPSTFLRVARRFAFVSLATLALGAGSAPSPTEFDAQRSRFVHYLKRMGISDPNVLDAFEIVRREAYCLPSHREHAYEDRPLPIGHGQTISQPSLVAYMTEVLRLAPGERVLEIGTGSGFQAAILAETGARLAARAGAGAEAALEVYTIEIVDALARSAQDTLHREGYASVHVRAGDGYRGWPEAAPFDAIILTAAPDSVPAALLEQLRPGRGRLLVPEGPQGPSGQMLRLYEKNEAGEIRARALIPVRFVPMVRGGASRSREEPKP